MLCAAATLPAAEPLRVMPLGDSITQGARAALTYRRPLWHALEAAGHDVDFVGSVSRTYRPSGEASDFDADHEGHWGWRADQILRHIDDWAARARPHVVLLHIGTNDIGAGQDIDETVSEVRAIVARLRAHNPRVAVLVAAIIPLVGGAVTASVEAYNGRLRTLAGELDRPAARVVLVDHFSGFDPQMDSYDGVHPNASGAAKMAQRWLAALNALLAADAFRD